VRTSTAGTPPRRTRRRGAVASALFVVLALALTACGAGQSANTARPYQPSLGSDAVVGKIWINDTVVVTDGNIPELATVIVNQGRVPDTLESLQITGTTSVAVPQGGVDIPPTNFVTFGPAGQQRILIDSLQAGLGQLVTVTYFFRVAGSVSVSAIVTTPNNLFAGT
jgi:hypothetical protein